MLRQVGILPFGSLDLSVGRSVTLVPSGGGGGGENARTAWVSGTGNDGTGAIETEGSPYATCEAAITALVAAYPTGPLTLVLAADLTGTHELFQAQDRLTVRGSATVFANFEVGNDDERLVDLTLDDITIDSLTVNASPSAPINTIRGLGSVTIYTLTAVAADGINGTAGSTHTQDGIAGVDYDYGPAIHGGDGGTANGGAGTPGEDGQAAPILHLYSVTVGNLQGVGGSGGTGGAGGDASANGGKGGIGPFGGPGGDGGDGGTATAGDGGPGGDGGAGSTVVLYSGAVVTGYNVAGGAGGLGGFGGSAYADAGLYGTGGEGAPDGNPGNPGTATAGSSGADGSAGANGSITNG